MILVLLVRMLIPVCRTVSQDALESGFSNLHLIEMPISVDHALGRRLECRQIMIVRHVERLRHDPQPQIEEVCR